MRARSLRYVPLSWDFVRELPPATYWGELLATRQEASRILEFRVQVWNIWVVPKVVGFFWL